MGLLSAGSDHDATAAGHLFGVAQREILDVQPCPSALAGGEDGWDCSCCGSEYRPAESWRVSYRVEPARVLTFVVCPACGHDLVPLRVTVDVGQADALASDGLGPLADALTLAHRVRSQRRTAERRIRLRASDLAELADRLGLGRVQLILRLRDAGLAVDP